MNKSSYKVALGGVIAALCLLGMFLTGVIPFLNMTLPMIAGALITVMAVEVSNRWAVMTYITVCFLSVFVTFDKTAALLFILFFGHYPIIKPQLEKVYSKLAAYILKIVLFNICIHIYYECTIYILGLKDYMDSFAVFGKYAIYFIWGLSNIFFLMYDYALGGIIDIYINRMKPKIFGKKNKKK